MYQPLLLHIAKFIQLDPSEEAYFLSILKIRKLRKRQILLHAEEVCHYSYYVQKGCLRTYQTDDQGNEHVLFFSPEDWWAGDLYSLYTGTPSVYTVEALEHSEVVLLEKYQLELLYERVPKFERYFRILIQNAFVATQRRVLSAIGKSAEERYLEFIERYPDLEMRIPQHQIASYLGIAPESLSRLRKQIRKKVKSEK